MGTKTIHNLYVKRWVLKRDSQRRLHGAPRGPRAFLGINALCRILSSRGAHRRLRRHAARSPSPAPDRQGQQARQYADHDSGAARRCGLPRTAIRRIARPQTDHGESDRPPRLLSDGCEDRQGNGHRRDISPHPLRRAAITDALDAGISLREAQMLAPRRPAHNRALRPRTRKLDQHGVHSLTAAVAVAGL